MPKALEENKRFEAIARSWDPDPETLKDEVLVAECRSPQIPPSILGDYCYRTTEPLAHGLPSVIREPVMQRQPVGRCGGNSQELVLDGRLLSLAYPDTALTMLRVSPDQNILAFVLRSTAGTTDSKEAHAPTSAAEQLLVWDIESQEIFPVARGVFFGMAWSRDSKRLFFTSGKGGRAERIYSSAAPFNSSPTLLYRDSSGSGHISLATHPDAIYLGVKIDRIDSVESFLINTANAAIIKLQHTPDRQPVAVVQPLSGDRVALVTHTGSGASRLDVCTVTDRGTLHSSAAVRFDSEVMSLHPLGDALVLAHRSDGRAALSLWRVHRGDTVGVSIPLQGEGAFSLRVLAGDNSGRAPMRVLVSSIAQPSILYSLNSDGTLVEESRAYCQGAARTLASLRSARIIATSRDGTHIPVSLYGSNDALRGHAPTVLLGYGAYGTSLDPAFNDGLIPLLRRGMLIAVAHVRGGGEFGAAWHRRARDAQNFIAGEDFVDSARALIASGVSREGLIAYGRSAGALLVLHAAHTAHESFRAGILESPLLDVQRMLTNPATAARRREELEWGKPDVVQDRSRLENRTRLATPLPAWHFPILIQHASDDEVIPAYETIDWLDRQRRHSGETGIVTARFPDHGGHSGSGLTLDHAQMQSEQMAFIIQQFRGSIDEQ